MSIETFKIIVDEFSCHRPNFGLTLHKDGEPLMNPYFFQMIEYLKSKGGRFGFHTNGTLLSLDKIKEFRKLPTSRKDSVTVSVNAHNRNSYRSITGKDLYEKVVSNVENLNTLRDKIRIRILIVEHPQLSLSEIEEFKSYWCNKVDEVIINKFRSWGGVFKTEAKVKRFPCLNLFDHPAINYNGDLMLCCQTFSYLKDAIVGNIHNDSILNIWQNNESLLILRKQQLYEEYDLHPICSKCNSWENYPKIWPKGYRLLGLPAFRSRAPIPAKTVCL